MATIYSSESNKILSEFIKEIVDIDSKAVIPDLQRPYIWNPAQKNLCKNKNTKILDKGRR